MPFYETAVWIASPGCEAPLLGKLFSLEAFTAAEIKICGLGFFELYINGKKVSCDLLTPVWSDYEGRKSRRLLYPLGDAFTHRVYYKTYPVTEYLREGENKLEALLGNGWYNQHERNIEGDLWYGKPKLCFDMCVKSNDAETHIVSDESLVWKRSRIIFNNIYFGETQDFRIEKQSPEEYPVMLTAAPDAELCEQLCPSDKVMRIIEPVKLCEQGSTCVYDAQENITGWARFNCALKRDKKVTVRYAEDLNPDGTLNFLSAGGSDQIQQDVFISEGNNEYCEPKFTYHGFRYFEITGAHTDLEVAVVHSDVKVTSSFSCSNPALTTLYEAFIRTMLGNMHCGVPSDCPTRERLGYTGDGQLTCESALLMLDSGLFYEKWMQDIADCQDKTTGHVQHTAPFYGGGGGPGGWGCAIVMLPYRHYRQYGDRKILEKYYGAMLLWLKYMEDHCENGLVVREEKGGWCLGDWSGISQDALPPAELVNTYYLLKSYEFAGEIAVILGKAGNFENEIAMHKDAVRNKFYDAAENTYGNYGADAFAIDARLGNRQMLDNLAAHYKTLGEFDTGIFGTDVLIDVLFKNGYADTACLLLASEKGNSFGSLFKQGATTFCECWNSEKGSKNHPMFGGCVKSLFYYVLGISTEAGIIIKPLLTDQIPSAQGSILSRFGKISVSYKANGKTIDFAVYSGAEAWLVYKEHKIIVPPERQMTYSFEV